MATVDLDKKRAARREAKQEGPKVKFGNKTYKLPAELPFSVLEGLAEVSEEQESPAALVKLVKALLGDHYEAFMATEPSMSDVEDLIEGVMTDYGVAPGESQASSEQ